MFTGYCEEVNSLSSEVAALKAELEKQRDSFAQEQEQKLNEVRIFTVSTFSHFKVLILSSIDGALKGSSIITVCELTVAATAFGS